MFKLLVELKIEIRYNMNVWIWTFHIARKKNTETEGNIPEHIQ